MQIELKDIYKYYLKGQDNEVLALNKVSLSVESGEMIAVMGPSGSGKSTMLHILAGLIPFDSGAYLLDGENVNGMSDKKKAHLRNSKIGIVMQNYSLIEDISAYRNIVLPLQIAENYNKNSKIKVNEIAEKLSISDLLQKKVRQLSGGQKQRVAIARALIGGANIILADEPTGALDSENSDNLMNLIIDLNKEGITVIIVTHDNATADYCKRKIILHDGQIVDDN